MQGEEGSKIEDLKEVAALKEEEDQIEEEEEATDQLLIEDVPKISPEDMDALLIEAFYRSIMESVKDSDLPLEPSDLQNEHLSLYQTPEGSKL